MKNRKRESGDMPTLCEKVCKTLEIMPDTLPGEGLIELRGRNYMRIHGEGTFILYTPERIKIKMRRDFLIIEGSRLCCISYYTNAIGIEGMISGFYFVEE